MTRSRIPKSESLNNEARRHLVGGVNSPVRAFGAVGGTPRFIQKAKGATLTDVDGNTYIDFVGSWGPMILGHGAEPVVKAIRAATSKGTSFGAPTEIEIGIAKLIKKALPSMDQIRFTNSGTEATMSALRLARAATKRERIVKFEGGYHGHSDGLLVSAGSGALTFGVPSSAGVPGFLARTTWVLPYNEVESLDEIFRTQGPNIAAAIIEPVAGNMGTIPAEPFFLHRLRQLTKKYGTILIFDEVMTGFRLGWGGAQQMYSVTPDLTCLGKIIGGGLPVGAFGGPRELMERLSPLGPVYQAGTLSGNPLAMAAGLATLTELKRLNPYSSLNKRTEDLCAFIRARAKAKRIPVQVNQVGSMFTVFFNEVPVNSFFTANESDAKRYATFFHLMLDQGVALPPSQFEAAFVSVAHTKPILDKAKKAFAHAFHVMASLA